MQHYRQTDRQTESGEALRQTDRQTDRVRGGSQTDGQTDRQTDRVRGGPSLLGNNTTMARPHLLTDIIKAGRAILVCE